MAYLDIQPTETEFETINGDFKLVDRAANLAGETVVLNPGDLKYAPTIGGSAFSYLNSGATRSVIQRSFTVALKSAGFNKPIVDVSDFPNTVKVNNDEVLTSNG